MKRHDFVRGTVLLTAIAATTLVASTPSDTQPTNDPVGTAGLRVYLDPETGDLQAGPAAVADIELDADTQNAVRRDTEGLEMVRHANGAISMNLQGRYESVAMVRIDENGVATLCDDDGTRIENALKGETNVATPEVK